jgi:sugar/nucleoside kinase (ribokinase family)
MRPINELNERLIYWQKRLRLQDWGVNIRLCHPDEIDAQGLSCIKVTSKSVKIKILDPKYFNDLDAEIICQNWEITLIHELLHLHFVTFDRIFDRDRDNTKDARDAVEQSIELIAQALYAQ